MFNDKQPGYRRLRSIIAERTNRLVIWLGAGLSIPAGLPSWLKLKESLCDIHIDKASAGRPDELDRAKKFATQIKETEDNWLAFQMLKEAIGPSTYRAAIRELFQSADICKIPENYLSILSLPVTGILNLNLDRLASRAFTSINPGKLMAEFGAYQAGQQLHILKGASPFIVNLHGTLSDEGSWVLTRKELRALLKQEGYQNFIRSCLCTRTVLFVGISADDISTGGHLEALSDAGVSLGDHFWITDRKDASTDYWAEHTQLQLIRYESKDGDHSELKEMLKSLGNYRPDEEIASPVTMRCTRRDVDLPSANEMQGQADPEIIRELLNAHAVNLLKPNPESGEIDYERYNYFCMEYDEAIYRAWYVTSNPPRNRIFGYRIEAEVADGAFGRVFRALDKRGRPVAIKVLREEVRRKPEMLQSFRRGVRSMRILAKKQVQGMIPYEEASEIPAVAVMEFVEGPNLQEAVESGCCHEWADILEIGVQIANIIRRAHLLPERVLHRDLRPPNIMLRDYYTEKGLPRVVILDFDLSWHLGAQEASVVNQSSLGGFLAPEQVDRDSGMSTRSAAVDSFGIGMTLFFLRTGKEPHYLQHLHKTWEDDLSRAILKYHCDTWCSIPSRFSRLILNATKHKQAKRWDMGQIEGELELLRESILYPMRVCSAELLAEELAHRVVSAGGYPHYHWDQDKLCASLSLPSGVELKVIADESAQNVKLQVEWSNMGDRHYKNVRKYLKPAMDESISSLKARGWKILPLTHYRIDDAGFSVSMKVKRLVSNIELRGIEITDILRKFNF